MNYFLITVENDDDVLIEAKVVQSELTMEKLWHDDWKEIAKAAGFSLIEGDIVDIEPVVNPPVI